MEKLYGEFMKNINMKIFTLAFFVGSLNVNAAVIPAVSCSGFEINKDGSFNKHSFFKLLQDTTDLKFRASASDSEFYNKALGIDAIKENTLVDFIKLPRAGYSRIKSFDYATANAMAPNYKYNGTIAAGLYDNLLAYSNLKNDLVKVSGNINKTYYLTLDDLVDVKLLGKNNSSLTCHRSLPSTLNIDPTLDENGELIPWIRDDGAIELKGSWSLWSDKKSIRSPESLEAFWCDVQGNIKDVSLNLYKVLKVVNNETLTGKETFKYPESKIRTGEDREVLTNNGYEIDKANLEHMYGKFEGIAITQTSCGIALLCNEMGCSLEKYNGATIVPQNSLDKDLFRNRY
jgi:hypothetical protein